MANVAFRRGDTAYINAIAVTDGQILFDTQSQAIYMDNGSVRGRYGGGNLSRSDVDTALKADSINPVQNKVIYASVLKKTDVINTLSSAIAVTNTQVPVGCGVAKELNNKISNSGDAYSTTKAYAVGDLVIHNNVLYRCKTACSAGSWTTNQSCFTADTLVNSVNEHYSELTKTGFGDADNIETFQSAANMYTFPCDGYILLGSSTRTSGIIQVNICSNTGEVITRENMNITGANQTTSVYVRKGMKCYVQDRSDNTVVQFRKIN